MEPTVTLSDDIEIPRAPKSKKILIIFAVIFVILFIVLIVVGFVYIFTGKNDDPVPVSVPLTSGLTQNTPITPTFTRQQIKDSQKFIDGVAKINSVPQITNAMISPIVENIKDNDGYQDLIQSCPKYYVAMNKKFTDNGTFVSASQVTDEPGCQALCDGENKCNYYSYDIGSKTCNMFTIPQSPLVNTGIKTPNNKCRKYYDVLDMGWEGNPPATIYSNETYAGCQDKCTTDNNCDYYVFNTDTRTCYTHGINDIAGNNLGFKLK